MQDYSRDSKLENFGVKTLEDRYYLPGETSPQDVFARAAKAFADDEAHAQRLYDYVSNLWFMFSTPILANAGSKRGLPISCYLNWVGDSREEIAEHYTENMFLASMGGGIGGCWSSLRSNGTSTSSGSQSLGFIPFLKVVDSEILAVAQGKTRRGSYAAYQDISHPEIEEFLIMRKATGGDPERKCLNLHNGVNIPDSFMEAVLKGKDWDLIDPHSKEVRKTLPARYLWTLLLETRASTGEPYIHFIDESNRKLPNELKEKGLRVHSSNLCSEVLLPVSPERTAVCCLSSVNLETYDEWKDHPTFIEDLIRMLDNVLTYFIENAPDELYRAARSAFYERSLGLGAMGFHSYLQKEMIPFEGPIARGINDNMFKHIKSQAYAATVKLAGERGSAPDAGETKVRNLHLMAVAPNASTSIIANTSPSIEPIKANAYVHKTMSGSFFVKNRYLEKLLESKGQNTEEVWKSIIGTDGSVQHLDFLTDWEKSIFKTAIEIDQLWVVEHASVRQQYICQSQSLNLFFLPGTSPKRASEVHIEAWKKKLKTLYYYRSQAVSRPELISAKIERAVRADSEEGECFSCQG